MSPSTMLQLLPTYRSQAGCDHGFGVAIGYGFSSTANDGRLGMARRARRGQPEASPSQNPPFRLPVWLLRAEIHQASILAPLKTPRFPANRHVIPPKPPAMALPANPFRCAPPSGSAQSARATPRIHHFAKVPVQAVAMSDCTPGLMKVNRVRQCGQGACLWSATSRRNNELQEDFRECPDAAPRNLR